MPDVFLNGGFLDRSDARIGAMDAGLQHGVGLFETMLGGVRGGLPWVFRLGDHLERLAASARELGLSDSLRTGPLGDAVLETAGRAGHLRARIRLTVTGGDLNMLASGAGERQTTPTVLIVPQPATEYPQAMFDRGIAVAIADIRANPLNPFESHKTLGYWWRLRQLRAAGARGAGEAIVLQVSNHLCGGCVSNIFLVKEGRLLTPIARGEEGRVESTAGPARKPGAYLPSPVLPGIARGAVLDLAASLEIAPERQMLSAQDMLDADEVFLTNSSWGVLPVTSVLGLGERRPIGSGQPGPLTTRLRAALLNEIENEASVGVDGQGADSTGDNHDKRS